MKIRLTTPVVCFLLLAGITNAQTINFKKEWAPQLKQEKIRNEFLEIIGSDETGAYTLKFNADDNLLYIEHIGNDLNVVSSSKLPLTDASGKRRWYEFSIYLNNQIYVLSSFADKTTKKRTLYAQLFNKQTRTLEPETILTNIDFQGNWRANSGFFSYRLSLDQKKVLIYAKLPYSFVEPEQFDLLILDDQLKPLWKKQISLPYKDNLFEWESMRISSAGEVYLLGVAYTDLRRNKRGGTPNYTYELFRYSQNQANETHKTLNLKDQFITDMQIGILENNDVVCAGFYSELGTFANKGTYFIKLDAHSNEIVNSQLKEYSLDMITENLTEKQAERVADRVEKGKAVELPNYNLDRLLVDDAGGVVLIGEVFSARERKINDETFIQYFYGEIFVVRISPSGDILWTKKIPKRQISRSDGGKYLSYTFGTLNNRLAFVFNNGLIENVPDNPYSLCTLDKDGNLLCQAIGDRSDPFISIRPKVSGQLADGSFLMFGELAKIHQFLRVTVKD